MNFNCFLSIVAFVYGAVFGSFLNVCIFRIPKGKSLLYPGSSCPDCSSSIAFYDNIPIFSYIMLGGKCRKCSSHISFRYPSVELVTAFISLFLFRGFGLSAELLYFTVFSYSMIVLAFIDYDYKILPNMITIPGAFIGFSGSFFVKQQPWIDSAIGMLTGPLFFLCLIAVYYFIRKKEGMGMGDVKMAAMIGAFLGWKLLFLTIVLSSLAGSAAGLSMIFTRKNLMETALPFGTFLGAASIFSVLWGKSVINWYAGLFP